MASSSLRTTIIFDRLERNLPLRMLKRPLPAVLNLKMRRRQEGFPAREEDPGVRNGGHCVPSCKTVDSLPGEPVELPHPPSSPLGHSRSSASHYDSGD